MFHVLGFLSLVILVYLGMQYYVAFWVIRSFPGLPVSPLAVRLTVLVLALLALVMYVWTGVLLIWVFWAACGDLAFLSASLAGFGSRAKPIIAWTVLAAVGLSSLHALWNGQRLPRVARLEVTLPNLPGRLDGFTIVQISDLHLGVTVPLSRLEDIASSVDKLHPDLIALTGDFVDPGPATEEAIAKAASRLHARHGKLAVLGNHEFYHGVENALSLFRKCGARVLRDEVIEVAGIQIVGIDDIMAGRLTRDEVSATLSKLDPAKPSVFLSHQPRFVDLASEKGVGLMLSGHTHQGQIFPFGLLARLSYRYFHGLYRRGTTSIYVTSGAGHWGPPMRFLTRAEVAAIVLRSPDRQERDYPGQR
ncbi:MAG: metallophosphoesterase [Elusimicrobia bacterium]|nr:metallophosphoesterase [Elusimicrobiota bacterium]